LIGNQTYVIIPVKEKPCKGISPPDLNLGQPATSNPDETGKAKALYEELSREFGRRVSAPPNRQRPRPNPSPSRVRSRTLSNPDRILTPGKYGV
jgi:hypothetical protein